MPSPPSTSAQNIKGARNAHLLHIFEGWLFIQHQTELLDFHLHLSHVPLEIEICAGVPLSWALFGEGQHLFHRALFSGV